MAEFSDVKEETGTQEGDPGINAPEATEEQSDSLFDALMNLGGDTPTEQPAEQAAEATETQEQKTEGDEGTGEQTQEQEISTLQRRFTDAEGNFDSAGALKVIEELGGLHSQTAKGLAEKDEYIQRLERALEAQAKGGQDQTPPQEQKQKILPENYGGTLTEDDIGIIVKQVTEGINAGRRQEADSIKQARENAAVDRAGTFKSMTESAAAQFKKTYGITEEQGNAMDEILLGDPELTEAAERYVLRGEGEFPAELWQKKFNQAYGAITQKTETKPSADSGGIDMDALAEKLAEKLGITRTQVQQAAREGVDAVSRDTEHPIQPIETEGDGEKDYFEQYLESRGMQDLDPSLKMLLREMETGTPN